MEPQKTAQCTKCIRIWDTQPLQIMIKRTLFIRIKTDLLKMIVIFIFICDQPHLVKTVHNNLHRSGFDKTFSCLLWNDNHYLTWSHIKDLMLDYLELGLQLCPKITTEHIKLAPFSVMNVRLAAQVLSTSVSVALKEYGQPETAGTAKYCEMFDKFFDYLNVRNTTECITKHKPFLSP